MKAKHTEIHDPTVKECEFYYQQLDGDFENLRLHRAFSKDYLNIEYPISSIRKTTVSPQIEWLMNEESCLNQKVFYKYREVEKIRF